MFRELARIKQKLTLEESIALLKTELRGVLSLLGDDGYPYGLPIDHWYNEEDGCIYFHSGPTGHKVDAMKANSKASFCVYAPGNLVPSCASSSPAFCMIYSACKLSKQGDNIHP